MTINYDNEEMNEPTERRPITIEALRQRAICKKRYGRATVTIHRWGGYSSLVRDSDLSKKVTAYRAGEATADQVAWAFVRARVKGHSPTFRWKGADLERLVKLVTDCSESPHFKAETADELAAELVEQQDKEREQMKRLLDEFSQSFAGIGSVSNLLQPQLTKWAAQQNKLFQNLSRSFVTPNISKPLARIVAPSLHGRMLGLGLTESVRKAMFPTLRPGFASSLVAGSLPRQSLLAQRVVLPTTFHNVFSKTLQQSLALHGTQIAMPALETLARSQTVTIGQVVNAAHEAAALGDRDGEHEGARDLVEVTNEVVQVVAAPAPDRVEQSVAELSRQIEALGLQLQEGDKKQQSQSVMALVLTILLFLLQIYIDHGLPMQPPAPPQQPELPQPTQEPQQPPTQLV